MKTLHCSGYSILDHRCDDFMALFCSQAGDSCMVVPSVSTEDAKKMFPKMETKELPSGKQYLRFTPQPWRGHGCGHVLPQWSSSIQHSLCYGTMWIQFFNESVLPALIVNFEQENKFSASPCEGKSWNWVNCRFYRKSTQKSADLTILF